MPYLNWREKLEVKQTIQPEDRTPSQLRLEMPKVLVTELCERLKDTFLNAAGELRLDLPENWIIFWKLRELDTRLLVAHPQRNEWVTTVAAEIGFAEKLVSALEGLAPGSGIRLSEVGTLGAVSNVDVEIIAV